MFLSDLAFLRKLASSDVHKAERPPNVGKRLDKVPKPQEFLRTYFRKGSNPQFKYFNKYEHNIRLAQAWVEKGDLSGLRKHRGYKRLIQKIAEMVE